MILSCKTWVLVFLNVWECCKIQRYWLNFNKQRVKLTHKQLEMHGCTISTVAHAALCWNSRTLVYPLYQLGSYCIVTAINIRNWNYIFKKITQLFKGCCIWVKSRKCSCFVIRTLHDCPSQMNENLLISYANQQIWVHLWGTVMLDVYYIMARLILTKYAHEFK